MEQQLLKDLENGNPINLFDGVNKEFVKFMLNRDAKGNFWKQMVSESKFSKYRCMEQHLSLKDVSDIISNMEKVKVLPTNNN